ncbi:hypothetical protein C1884_28105 [Pseudomonas sp. GW460-R15]|nr:hypothetical protein C1887_28315 [Pseudomonas sp. GW456-R21]POA61762.1 hypothetical protein C1884_28105 [Pseudomonas sp. GW460-R15]
MARGLAPVGSRSGPQPSTVFYQTERIIRFTTALQPNGGKPPRHSFGVCFSSVHNHLFHLVGSAEYAFRLLRKRYS